MARINVSVPDSLKERMAALGNKVNWSEVAQAAFEREVSARTFHGEDMEQVIERLRLSKAKFLENQTGSGRRRGREWAQLYADYDDLQRLSKLHNFSDGNAYAYQFDLALGNIPEEGASFWVDEETGRVEYPNDEYVAGYLEGALSVWAEVKDKL
ncbi:hypothetical protein AB7M49_008180 [Bradyrhizobium elkanii]